MADIHGKVKSIEFRSKPMKSCNHHVFILRIKCPFYFIGLCTLEKLSLGKRDCFLKEKMKEFKDEVQHV